MGCFVQIKAYLRAFLSQVRLISVGLVYTQKALLSIVNWCRGEESNLHDLAVVRT
jgi:hypothetical protein